MTRPADQLSHDQLATVARELLLCGHLIDRVTMPHVLGAWDRETMRDIAIDEWMGASPLYTRRTQAPQPPVSASARRRRSRATSAPSWAPSCC